MIGEIAAIVAGVNAATSAIKQVAETTNDIQSISGFLSTLGGAEVELARSQNSGKLSEADAVKAALAKKQIQETMAQVKDLFTVSGNGQLYQDAMQAMADARKAKQAELAAKMAAKKTISPRHAPTGGGVFSHSDFGANRFGVVIIFRY